MNWSKAVRTVRMPSIFGIVSHLCYKPLCLVLIVLPYLYNGLGAMEDVCSPNPCANGGQCVRPMHQAARLLNPDGPPHSSYQCLCPNGWAGQNCTEDLNDCADQPCLNGGVCENRLNMRYLCHCGEDFVGQNCEYTNPCKENPCENGGICQADILGRFTCECPRWYKGEHCEVERDPCHPVNPCQGPKTPCILVRDNHSTTDGIGRVIDFRCECGPGHTGRYCEAEEDLCARHNCTNGGKCFYQGNQTVCICPPGFHGSNCQMKHTVDQEIINNLSEILNENVEPFPRIPSSKTGWSLCERTGCLSARAGDYNCRADCVLNGCLGLEELNDCPSWQACLAESELDLSRSIHQSCLGRFRDGKCDAVCNIPECYFDGMDCAEENGLCEHYEFCTKHYADDKCQLPCATSACGFDGGDCLDKSLPIDPMIPPDPSTKSREPLLFLGTLNGTTKVFEMYRKTFLATIGMLVQGVVRIWRDQAKNSEVMSDLPHSTEMKLVFAIWLCSPFQNQTECSNPLFNLNSRDLSNFILSALTIGQGPRLPIAFKQLAPVEDSGQLDFSHGTEAQWSRFLRSKEAVGIYVCLCILAGIIVILVIFIVLQRDPWRKPNKRVYTTGVWCPPVPMGLKHETRQMNRVAGFTAPNTHGPTASYKQHELLLNSYIQDLHGSEFTDKCGPSLPNQHLESNREQSTIQLDSFTKQVKPIDTQLKRKLFDSSYLLPEDLEEQTQPPAKSVCLNNKNSYVSGVDQSQAKNALRTKVPNGAYDSSGEQLLRHDYSYRIGEECQPPSDSPLGLTDQLSSVLKNQDGLHPLTSQEVATLGAILQPQKNNLWLNPSEVSMRNCNEPGKQDQNGLNRTTASGSEKHMNRSGSVLDESVLHLAGRMNSGRDAVLCLQPNLVSDNPTTAVTLVDSTGRTPLASAAAANALETVGALYQLEKEVLANNRAQTASKPSDGLTTQTNNTKSRRRQKQSEPRQPTALITAVQTGNDEVFRYLIDEGHPLSGVDEFGRNVIHWAAATNSVALLQRLVQCKGFYRLVNARDDYDRTPLMLATREGCEEAVMFLLEHKASVLATDCTENDPIKVARLKGFHKIEHLLLKYYNPDSTAMGLSDRCPQHQFHESPFQKGTDSPSETSEFDTQSIEADSEEREQIGELSTKQMCKHSDPAYECNTSGFHGNTAKSDPFALSQEFPRTAQPRVNSDVKIERSKRPRN